MSESTMYTTCSTRAGFCDEREDVQESVYQFNVGYVSKVRSYKSKLLDSSDIHWCSIRTARRRCYLFVYVKADGSTTWPYVVKALEPL